MVSNMMMLGLYKYSNDIEAISSIVLAIQMIIKYCKKLKYKRKIVLVTNGNGGMSDDGITGIIEKLKEDSIELVVLWVFRCAPFGFYDDEVSYIFAGVPTLTIQNTALRRKTKTHRR